MFYEQRFTEKVLYGSSFDIEYAVREFTTGEGNDYQVLQHPYQRKRMMLSLLDKQADIITDVLAWFARVGRQRGFRVKCPTDFSTNGFTGTPTFEDQVCVRIGPGVYQIMVWYDDPGYSLATRRRVLKPVAGTAVVGVAGAPVASGWTVDPTSGQITFATDPGELAVVTAGCEFDIPMRFASNLSGVTHSNYQILASSVELIETLNPGNS